VAGVHYQEARAWVGGIVTDEQLGLLSLAPVDPTPVKAWSKERGGGGFLYRTATRFGRIWPASDGRWSANRRPEPYITKNPQWEGPMTFKDRAEAEAWVERRTT